MPLIKREIKRENPCPPRFTDLLSYLDAFAAHSAAGERDKERRMRRQGGEMRMEGEKG